MVHHGIATRFTSGPAREACPNSATVSGSNATVATPWALRNPRSQPCSRPGRHQISHSTPAKLSQKPGARTASGSNNSIASAASDSDWATVARRRLQRAVATTAIISTVRTVGSAKPAAAAYSAAPATAAAAAPIGRGR